MDSGLIIRTGVLIYALINNVLVMSVSALPFLDQQVEVAFSTTLTVIATIWAWWKNNSITKEAKRADSYMKGLKNKKAS